MVITFVFTTITFVFTTLTNDQIRSQSAYTFGYVQLMTYPNGKPIIRKIT